MIELCFTDKTSQLIHFISFWCLQSLSGETSCDECEVGFYQDAEGAASCDPCPATRACEHHLGMTGLWSNSDTFDTGGDQGIVHGFWGSDVGSVSVNVTNPGWARPWGMRLQLRYWAIDSWDSGERAYVFVDDVEVWSFSRASSSGCSPFASYIGESNIPAPFRGLACYFDVDVVVGLAGRSSFVLTLGSTIKSGAHDESWGFGRVSMALVGL